jgi:hypothetical protein
MVVWWDGCSSHVYVLITDTPLTFISNVSLFISKESNVLLSHLSIQIEWIHIYWYSSKTNSQRLTNQFERGQVTSTDILFYIFVWICPLVMLVDSTRKTLWGTINSLWEIQMWNTQIVATPMQRNQQLIKNPTRDTQIDETFVNIIDSQGNT